MNSTAIKVTHLTKIYKLYDKPVDRLKESLHPLKKQYHKEFYALNDINFEIKKGETVGIIGKNGAGKSTLLKIITGVLTPTNGSVHVNGRIASLLELGAGFNPEYTGVENIYFQSSLMGYTREKVAEKVDEIIAFADIGDFVYQPVKMYSSGMYARLAFAIAINVDPDILIVDEALSVGDARFQRKSFGKLHEFREQNKSILFVSHSTSDIIQLAKRSIWLENRGIRMDGLSKHVTEKYIGETVHDSNIIVSTENSTKKDNNEHKLFDLQPIPPYANINGDGRAIIDAVGLFNMNNKLLKIIYHTQRVKVVFRVTANIEIIEPWIGFSFINNKGVKVVGSNSFGLQKQLQSLKESSVTGFSFEFVFPEIENGIYSISVAINDGNPDVHTREFNILDAYEFEFNSSHLLQKQQAVLKIEDCLINIIDAE